jgi:hypothetical protein
MAWGKPDYAQQEIEGPTWYKFQSVSIYVVDTVPEFPVGPPRSEHGLAMVDIVERLLADAFGVNDVVNVLGMPRYLDQDGRIAEDRERGGTFGTRGDLARGIVDAADHVQGEGIATSWRQLILVAAGWSAGEAEALALQPESAYVYYPAKVIDDDAMPVTMKAVVAAATYAGCKGATIIAAAGNVVQDECSERGPTGPAMLADVYAPYRQDCERFGLEWASGGPIVDLVTAVSPLASDGRMLPNARIGSQSSFLAAGASTVGKGGERVVVGSSVAGAVVVSAVALMSRLYGINAGDVHVYQLWKAGVEVKVSPAPDFGLGLGGGTVGWGGAGWYGEGVEKWIYPPLVSRKLQLCPALRWRGGECSPPDDFSLPIELCTDDASFVELAQRVGVAACGAVGQELAFETRERCASGSEKPGELLAPWALPQPRELLCPSCFTMHQSGGPFHVWIEPSLPASEYRGLTLEAVLEDRVLSYPILDTREHGMLSIPAAQGEGAQFRLSYQRRVNDSATYAPEIEPLIVLENPCPCSARDRAMSPGTAPM